MGGLTIHKWQCTDCSTMLKKKERRNHELLTGHFVSSTATLIHPEPEVRVEKRVTICNISIEEMERKVLQMFSTPAKLLSYTPEFTGRAAIDYPETTKAIQNLRLLMRATGAI